MLLSELYPIALLCIFLTGVRGNVHCEEKERALLDLDLAEHLIEKLKDLFPNCTNIFTNTSRCGVKVKVSVYLDKMKSLIEEARNNFPICIDPITTDPNIIEPVTEDPKTIFPLTNTTATEEPVTEPQEYPKSRDCSEVLQSGRNVSGVYTIWPDIPLFQNRSLDVYCDMHTDGGGWTVIQRRGNFAPQEDFYRDWKSYREGFGNIKKEFWLGNDNIFLLSNQGNYTIRFDLESAEGEKAYALYETFRIENETARYKLHIGNYTDGNAGDDMQYFNGRSFYTKDRDSSSSCAQTRMGAWWFRLSCYPTNLNGPYIPGARSAQERQLSWYEWKRNYVGLSGSEIKIRTAAH